MVDPSAQPKKPQGLVVNEFLSLSVYSFLTVEDLVLKVARINEDQRKILEANADKGIMADSSPRPVVVHMDFKEEHFERLSKYADHFVLHLCWVGHMP